MNSTAERPVAHHDILLIDESHRYYLQMMENDKATPASVPLTPDVAVQIVPPLLRDRVTRNAVLFGLFGTLAAMGGVWTYFAHPDSLLFGLLGVIGVMVLGVALAFFYAYQATAQFFFGDIVEGVVVHSESVDNKHYTLTYEFTTPADISIRQTVKGEWSKTPIFSPPPPGTTVALYYIDDNRFWLL